MKEKTIPRKKRRAIHRQLDSLKHQFVLGYRMKFALDELKREELERIRERMPSWLRWAFRLLSGGGTV